MKKQLSQKRQDFGSRILHGLSELKRVESNKELPEEDLERLRRLNYKVY